MDARLTELEIKLAYAEDLLETLNLTVFRQQEQIELLQHQLRELHRQVQAVAPSESRNLRELARSNVKFLGFRNDLPGLLRQAHLHVLLSRNEGLAKVLLEAGASGVPNLCTQEAGLPTDASGTLFIKDRSSEDEVATSIENCYRDPAATARLGLEARQMVISRFGWAAFRERFAQVVAEVTQSQ